MQLAQVSRNILSQLSDVMRQLAQEDFSRPSKALSQATVGQHIRHILEFFLCLERGLVSGNVNYDNRDRDERIECDKEFALDTIAHVYEFVATLKTNRSLVLEFSYEDDSDNTQSVDTNIFRELTYTIEHAVHHMAMVKIGLRDVAPSIAVPEDFGVAASTLRHNASLLAEG